MPTVTLRPNSLLQATGGVAGSENPVGAMADESDGTAMVLFADTAILRYDMTTFTLPAGAIVKQSRATCRAARESGSFHHTFSMRVDNSAGNSIAGMSGNITPGSTAYSTINGPYRLGTLTQADINGLQIRFTAGFHATLQSVHNISRAAIEITYVAKPMLSVTAPTGVISTLTVPNIAWSRTLDAEGGVQTRYQVKIFTLVQTEAPGFNPSSTIPIYNSGEVVSAATNIPTPALNRPGYYCAYVRIAQTINSALVWSDWNSTTFQLAPFIPDSSEWQPANGEPFYLYGQEWHITGYGTFQGLDLAPGDILRCTSEGYRTFDQATWEVDVDKVEGKVYSIWGLAKWGWSAWRSPPVWNDELYPIRRAIKFDPLDFLPGSETALSLKFNHQIMDSMGGFNGMKIVYLGGENGIVRPLPFTVVSSSESESTLIFDRENPIVETTDNEYYLYYGYTKGVILPQLSGNSWDREASEVVDYPGAVYSRLSFSRPTVDWVNGISATAGAKASFVFQGDQLKVNFKRGPDKGQVLISIDDDAPFLFDTYDATAHDEDFVVGINQEIAEHRVIFTVAGTKSGQSSGVEVGISDIKYNQILIGELQEEEYNSTINESYLLGV